MQSEHHEGTKEGRGKSEGGGRATHTLSCAPLKHASTALAYLLSGAVKLTIAGLKISIWNKCRLRLSQNIVSAVFVEFGELEQAPGGFVIQVLQAVGCGGMGWGEVM